MRQLDLNSVHPDFRSVRPQLSRFMVHLWRRLRLQHEFHLRNEASRHDYAVHFVSRLLGDEGLDASLIPTYLADYLTEPIAGPPLSYGRVSRLMADLLAREGALVNARTAEAYTELAWRYVERVHPKWSLPGSLIPGYVIDFLNEVDPASAGVTDSLSRFWKRVHRESPLLSEKYDLTCVSDRRGYIAEVILESFGKSGYESLFPDHMLEYWTARLSSDSDSPTRFEYLVFHSHRLSTGRAGRAPAAEAPAWFADAFCRLHPRYRRFASRSPAEATNSGRGGGPPGGGERSAREDVPSAVTVVGHGNTRTGLGANLRMSARALGKLGLETQVYDERWENAPILVAKEGEPRLALNRDICLIHVNADAVPRVIARWPEDRADGYRIGFFLWELTEIPREHELGMALVDEIWVPSEFLRRVYSTKFAGPVVNVKKGCSFAAPNPALRKSTFGVSDAAFCYVTYFDFDSSIRRKNPTAVVRAFQRAFPTARDVALVVKCCNVRDGHWGNRFGDWEELLELSAGDDRIRIINEVYSEEKLMSLINVADAFVSLHRSEGFGYGPLQALWLGKPVVVTDFSGTQDYCSEQTAFLVKNELVFLEPGEFIFDAPGARWAEPDVAHAAELMQRVYRDRAEANRRAATGQRRVQEEYSLESYAEHCRGRLDDIAGMGHR